MNIKKDQKIRSLINDLEEEITALTGAAEERVRLEALEHAGGLDGPAYALSPGMEAFDIAPLVADYQRCKDGLDRLMAGKNDTGYTPGNGYFDTPDAEALYLMVSRFAPKRVVEIGCGNSTRITRQASSDGNTRTQLTAIDPYPRADIDGLPDRFIQARLEQADMDIFAQLRAGDILFIDSSHQVRIGNDVSQLFCRIIPALASGVVIHVHDVFLPYEYPKRFFYDCPGWGEQYLLHALLQGGGYDILWPGYFLQQERSDAVNALPFLGQGRAQSFWMQKR